MVVIRPDSGDPVSTVLRVAKILASKFGVTVNAGGYKVLNNVRIIQGDGVNPKSIEEILQTLRENGFSADNIAFGMGGALLQHMNRDTLEFAMKASAIQINGVWNDVSKNPVNMPEKNSKGGRFKLTYEDGKYWTLPIECKGEDLLQVVFENGKIIREMTFSEVRANSIK
jgi:nicotinamide phosphoribosyltransferase